MPLPRTRARRTSAASSSARTTRAWSSGWTQPAAHWPERLRQGGPETRGFEIVLADVNS